MGVLAGVAGAVTIALDVVSHIAQAEEQKKAAVNENQALDEQSRISRIQFLQKSNSRLSQLSNVVEKQEAIESTRGVNLGSASFNAIQRDTFNVSQKQQQNLNIEQEESQQSINDRRKNIHDSLFSSLFGDAASTASDISRLKGSQNTKGKK